MHSIRLLLLASVAVLLIAAPARAEHITPIDDDPLFGEWITLFDGTQSIEDIKEDWIVSKPAVAPFSWEVDEDGYLTNIVKGRIRHNIATKRKFHHYETEIEFKISEGGNAGIYNRGRAEIQIYDSHGKEELGDQDMGALYKFKPPEVDATKPAGEWNHLYIRFIGNHIYAELNGQIVQNNTFITHKTGAGRTDAFDSPGIFEIQGDHDKLWLRKIRIRPLFEDDGWVRLTNDYNLDGWHMKGDKMEWFLLDGKITNKKFPIHDLYSDRDDFHSYLVHYEYASLGNSGVFHRNLWEIQIHSSHGQDATIHSDGALYDFYAPLKNMSRPAGKWQVIEARIDDRKITAHHNGTLIHDERECDAKTYRKSDSTGLDEPGPFRLQGEHGRVWFTNIFVKPLKD